MIKPAAFAICLFIFGAACGTFRPPTPAQEGAVVDGTCTMLSAFVGGPLEQALCATAEDIVAIEADARSVRADAGPGKLGRMSGRCQIVGTVCLTDAELAVAITHRKASR